MKYVVSIRGIKGTFQFHGTVFTFNGVRFRGVMGWPLEAYKGGLSGNRIIVLWDDVVRFENEDDVAQVIGDVEDARWNG